MKKVLITILLIICLSIGLCACKDDSENNNNGNNVVETPTLSKPTNVNIDASGNITWDAVEHATSYIVKIDDVEYTSNTNSYQAPNVTKSFNVTVTAKADGYNASAPSEQKTYIAKVTPKPPVTEVSVGIEGASEIRSGASAQYTATVTGSDNTEVTWSVIDGGDYVTIDATGVVTAKEVSGDVTVRIRATSKANTKSYAEKVIGIVAKPVLTQAMLDVFKDVNKMCFEGYMSIDVYSKGLTSKLERSYVSVIKTAMDNENGGHWYAEYADTSTGINQGIYYANHNGVASQIGLSLMNNESYYPLTDDDGLNLTWKNSGLYNNFVNLKVEDFELNDETWRYVYKHENDVLVSHMISSANPYDFDTKTFSLIIGDGEIMGITARSNPDETLLQGYTCYEELFVAVNIKDTVDVPTIPTYEYDEELHAPLKAALENMRSLSSYTADYFEMSYYLVTSTYVTKGYYETVTQDDCYFVPYSISKDPYGAEVKIKDESGAYGFHKINDSLYNSFFIGADLKSFSASRAYAGDFKNAQPSFAFAPEIFRSVSRDEDEGTTTYYVEKLMANVATTFYYGLGTDSNLYGIYATEGYVQNQPYLPYVTVKEVDGKMYITEAGFYFYLGSIYGFITMSYSDFDTATTASVLPEGVTNIDFAVRNVPASWNELTIVVSDDDSTLSEDTEVPANAYISEFFKATKTSVTVTEDDISASGVITWDGVADTAFYLVSYTVTEEDATTGKAIKVKYAQTTTETSFDTKADKDNISAVTVSAFDEDKSSMLPFFGEVLGDTYGFALNGMRIRSSDEVKLMKPVLQIYYDVPLDLNYSIDSSLKAVKEQLVSLGFEKNKSGEYVKDGVVVLPLDVSLDFIIYVWYDPVA